MASAGDVDVDGGSVDSRLPSSSESETTRNAPTAIAERSAAADREVRLTNPAVLSSSLQELSLGMALP
jgi:hypothetical protein